jgi:ABC-type lipoprotein release transport system permease subunit
VEALRYEGGASGQHVRRLPLGGMAIQGLWQRTARTLLTLGVIGITVGGIMALEALIGGMGDVIGGLSADAEVMVRQAGVADTSLSAIDERSGDRIGVLPGVSAVSGLSFSGTILPDSGTIFIVFGYNPNEFAIHQFNVVAGKPLSGNHQIMLGRSLADSLKVSVGDTFEVTGSRYKVVGIYEAGGGFDEMGGVITLRDAQILTGRPRKVSMYLVKVANPLQAPEVVQTINERIQDAHASLAGDFAEEMPDMQAMDGIMAAISILAIGVGSVGVMNTMLMAVLERTREIGVLRALGWRRRRVLMLILEEGLLLGLFGGALGMVVAFGLAFSLSLVPQYGSLLEPQWTLPIFLRAFTLALSLGLLGGLYPAYRATRLQPVEAIRYE